MNNKAKTLVQKVFHGKAGLRDVELFVNNDGQDIFLTAERKKNPARVYLRVSHGLFEEKEYSLSEWEKLEKTFPSNVHPIMITRADNPRRTEDNED